MHSKKEIWAIEKQIEDAAIEKVRREVQQSFLKTQETPQNAPGSAQQEALVKWGAGCLDNAPTREQARESAKKKGD